MSSCRLALSSRRSTTFSPNSVGSTETRNSISRRPDSLSLMRPSCGSRRSATSIWDMTFTREAMAFWYFFGGAGWLCITPSMR